jgi:hypothetical protein
VTRFTLKITVPFAKSVQRFSGHRRIGIRCEFGIFGDSQFPVFKNARETLEFTVCIFVVALLAVWLIEPPFTPCGAYRAHIHDMAVDALVPSVL